MSEDRKIHLEFVCARCGQTIILKSEEELIDLVETQLVGETRQLHCRECAG